MKKAFITGLTGQDGSYLAELLLEKGYQVSAIYRRTSNFVTQRIDHIIAHENLSIHYGDLTDSSNLHRILSKVEPDEIYNLGAQSHVGVSFEIPEYTADVTGLGSIRLLDAVRELKIQPRYYQASTSELFGGISGSEPQNELTPFYPKSPYATAKLFAFWTTVNYRESYGVFASNGILFNHESPRRGPTFVTKKITQGVARIKCGLQERIQLGNLNAKRDWGHARDYVKSMWLILQHEEPDDFVIATGTAHTVRDFVEMAFAAADIEIEWQGSGVHELGLDKSTGKTLVEVNPKYFRPTEVEFLLGDSKKAQKLLGWVPTITLESLVQEMVDFDLKELWG